MQHPSPPRRQGQEVVHPPETGSGGWVSDSAASAVKGLRIPEAINPEARYSGGRKALETMGEYVGWQQVGETWRSRRISVVKEVQL